MPRHDYSPLTKEQQKLLTPKILQMAEVFAKKKAKNPEHLDKLKSDNLYDLVLAAKCYDPSKGSSFTTHAWNRLVYRTKEERHSKKWTGLKLLSLDREIPNQKDDFRSDFFKNSVPDKRTQEDAKRVDESDEALWSTKGLRMIHKKVLDLRLRDDKTFKEIGRDLQMHGESARLLYGEAINRIRRSVCQRRSLKVQKNGSHDVSDWAKKNKEKMKRISKKGRIRAAKVRDVYYKKIRASTGWGELPPLEGTILNMMFEGKEIHFASLARELNKNEKYCKNVIQSLYRKGYLDKTKDKDDKRMFTYKLSQKSLDRKKNETT